MDWMDRIHAAIDYMEDNLEGTIDFTEVAVKAACSTFYFQRMFLAVTGITPAEYVRRRKLTLAATELSVDNAKVIDIALKYGYESPDAFTRAFKNMHGITPTAARGPGVKLTAFPRISFRIEVKGGTDMDYRILETPEFSVAMVSRKFSNIDDRNFKDIPTWWGEFRESADCAALAELSGNRPGKLTEGLMLGVCWGEEETGEFYYGIAVELPDDMPVGKFEKMVIPAGTWAVFDCMLPEFREVTGKVYGDWYPSTGFEHPGGPDIEVYLNLDTDENMKCRIWAPVVKKN